MEPQMTSDEHKCLYSIYCLLHSLVLSLSFPIAAEADREATVPVPKSILEERADYYGPEREEQEPINVQEVRIGFFAPHDSENPIGKNLWRGATLAVEQANEKGGYRQKPFRLTCRWADNPWGAGSREMIRLVYEDRVWAVIGSIDGASTHVAEQVATKARITLVSPLSGDPSLTHTAVPWMFRLPPDDASVAKALAKIAVEKMGFRRIIILSSTGHDGRMGTSQLLAALERFQVSPVLHLSFDPSQTDFSQQLDRIRSVPAKAIFLWGDPEASLRLLLALRGRGIELPVFGPPLLSLPPFLQEAAQGAGGLTTCKLTWARDGAGRENFAREFESRFGEKPADDAVLGYDAASILIGAIHKAGLNRARIRDAVADMSGFAGLAGKITWDNGGGNMAEPVPVTFQDGRLCEIRD
jgi:branched-chain amino acid transport system substrate-binding protein